MSTSACHAPVDAPLIVVFSQEAWIDAHDLQGTRIEVVDDLDSLRYRELGPCGAVLAVRARLCPARDPR